MSSTSVQPDHDPKRLYREQQDFLVSYQNQTQSQNQNTSGQAGTIQMPMNTGSSAGGPTYGTQDSKHLYQQQQDFLSSPQNMTGRPGTSQVPIDEATAADGPSYTTQEAPPQYISPAPTNLSYIATAQPNPVSTYQSNPFSSSFSQHNSSAASPIQSTSSQILPMRTPSWTKFMIPTKTESLSSGFPYDERLAALRISHENWFQFSSSIVKASKLTAKEDFAAWTTGITTGTLSSPFLLVFAPMVGIWAGKKVHRKTLQSNVEEKLTGDGDLRSILRNWNEHEFSKNGFQAWLEVPSTTGKNSSKRFSILIVPDDGMSPAAQPSLMPLHHPGLVEADAQQDIRELDGTQVEPARESRSIRRLQLTSTSNPVSRTNSPALPHAGYTDTKSGEIRHELE